MAAQGPDHYDVLGVGAEVTAPELRRAYLERARRWHPDAGGDAESMRRLNEAWSVLGDERRRRSYDISLGAAAVDAPSTGRSHGFGPGPIDAERDAERGAERGAERDADLLADLAEAQPFDVPTDRTRLLTVVPVLLFFASLATACTGVVLASTQLIGLAGMLALLSALFMVAMPFLVLARSRHR